MGIRERYSTAVHSRDLGSDPKTLRSDSDVLGAMGIADRALSSGRRSDGTTISPSPLAVPLLRLLSGDGRAAATVVEILAQEARATSFAWRVKLSPVQALDMGRACLAWFRDGTCRPCGGLGETIIPGSPFKSGHTCQVCRGTGKILFDHQFRQEHQPIARWLRDEMDKAMKRAGPEAMRAIKPTLEL